MGTGIEKKVFHGPGTTGKFKVDDCNMIVDILDAAMGEYSGPEGLKDYIDYIESRIDDVEDKLVGFPSIDYDFVADFTTIDDSKITCNSTELNIRNEDTLLVSVYTSGDIIPAGNHKIYGKEVDNVKFGELGTESSSGHGFTEQMYDVFNNITVIRNVLQTNATDMFFSLTTLVNFNADPETFGNVTNFSYAWRNCNSLTSFPLIDTSSGTSIYSTWANCNSLTSFPLIDTSNITTFDQCWGGCSSLTSFPLIDTSSGTDFSWCWYGCNSLTSFPLIDTSSGTDFSYTWYECSSLTSFPLIDFTNATNISYAWKNCTSLTCIEAIINDGLNNPDSIDTFLDCDALLRPDLTEQADIENGINWVNDTEC